MIDRVGFVNWRLNADVAPLIRAEPTGTVIGLSSRLFPEWLEWLRISCDQRRRVTSVLKSVICVYVFFLLNVAEYGHQRSFKLSNIYVSTIIYLMTSTFPFMSFYACLAMN